MTSHAPRLPFALDPLIAEAKQRMRRRRGAWLVLVLAGAVALAFALWPSGGPPAVQSVRNAQTSPGLASLSVPMDKYELQWRRWIRKPGLGELAPSTSVAPLRHKVLSYVTASGASVVRLTVWRTSAPPSVELVVATALPPAAYLRHRLNRLLREIPGEYHFVQVVNRRGKSIFENSFLTRDGHFEGMVGVPRRLQMCSPVSASWMNPLPCPAK